MKNSSRALEIVDLTHLALYFSLIISCGIAWAAIKPVRIFIVFIAVIVALHCPPINTQYLTLAYVIGSVNIHVFDLLLIGAGLIGIKIILSTPSIQWGKSLPLGFWFAGIVFISWHLFRMLIQIAMTDANTEMVMRMFAQRCFVVLTFLAPMALATSPSFSWVRMRSILMVIVGLLPLFAIINMIIVPEGIEVTSSYTRRFLMGTANIYLAFGFVLAMVGSRAGWFGKRTALLYCMWVLFGMLMTQHRSVVVALLALFLVDTFCFLDTKKKIIRLTGGAIMALAIAIALPAFELPGGHIVSEVVVRVTDTFDSDNATSAGRIDKWKQRLEIISENPWLGTGFGREDSKRKSSYMHRDTSAGHEAHNFVISILTYEGIIGLLVNFLLGIVALLGSWRLAFHRSRAGLEAPLLFMVYFLVYSFFNTTYFNPLAAPAYFACVGIIGYLQSRIRISTS